MHYVYGVRHVIANDILNATVNYHKVASKLKETVDSYEYTWNQYYYTKNIAYKNKLENNFQIHHSMITYLQDINRNLDTIINPNKRYLPDSYINEVNFLEKEIYKRLTDNIKKITPNKTASNVRFEGLKSFIIQDTIEVLILTDKLADTYNLQKIENYNLFHKRNEFITQHVLTLLTAFITLFFYVTTINPNILSLSIIDEKKARKQPKGKNKA